ncbi:MAG: LCCL domain-containing protein [Gemmata sp.]
MSDDNELFGLDDLPDEARAAVRTAERAIAAVREQAERESAEARARAERECEQVRARAEVELAAVQHNTTRELAPLVRALLERLRDLQQQYAREGLLDEALAIRARVRQLRSDLLGVRPDPGVLTEFTPSDAGRAALFEVTGRTDGNVWGTDVYTTDSRLATAVVHAGALRAGERGLVRVTIVDGTDLTYTASTRNEVNSFDYATYPVAYRVERV